MGPLGALILLLISISEVNKEHILYAIYLVLCAILVLIPTGVDLIVEAIKEKKS